MDKLQRYPDKIWKGFISVLSVQFFFLLSWQTFSQHPTIYYIEPHPDAVVRIEPTLTAFQHLSPGDTICLQEGQFRQIFLRNIHGSKELPITIINCGGKATINNNLHFGIAFHNCSHIRLLGNGSERHIYGLAITGTHGNGISIDMGSSNIDVAYVEIGNTGLSGIMYKSDPSCSDYSFTRERFTLYDANVHNNYIHNTGNEGIYIGSSFYPGFPLRCNGRDTLVLPHEVIGVHVYNNILERTGRNSIQVSSATERCFIHNNHIYEDSQKAIFQHMNGIQVGGGSCCEVYNNMIIDGRGSGVHYFGKGPAKIFNNLIVNPGRTHFPDIPFNEHPVYGIFIKHIYSHFPEPVHVLHNTIVNPKTTGIVFNNQEAPNSRIQNNIVINPGGFEFVREGAYINLIPFDIPLVISHNYFDIDDENVQFYAACDYDFSPGLFSPVINAGIFLGDLGVSFDIMNAPRPIGAAPDIGAFEFQSEVHSFPEAGFDFFIYPNPASETIRFVFRKPIREISRIELYDFLGKKIYSVARDHICPSIIIPVHQLLSGVYHVVIYSGENRFKASFIKLQDL